MSANKGGGITFTWSGLTETYEVHPNDTTNRHGGASKASASA